MRLKFCILFFRDWNHGNQYAFTISMNDTSDKPMEDVEMIFSMAVTLGMVSEMCSDVMQIDLYSFSYNIEIWDIFLLNSTCFLLSESTETPISI